MTNQPDRDDSGTGATRQLMTRLRALLPALAIILLLAAIWLAWGGWQQTLYNAQRGTLEQSRDMAVKLTSRTLASERKQLADRLASVPVQAALAAGDLSMAATRLAADWPGIEQAAMLPPDLERAYAGLPDSGFGRLGLAEAAIANNQPMIGVVRDGGGPRLALAAPARVGNRLIGVAYVRLPLSRATGAADSVAIDEDAYLALRQGSVTLVEHGDTSLNDAAERMAIAVPDTRLRVAVALPPPVASPFGLSGVPSFVTAAILLLLALLTWHLARKPVSTDALDDDASPTLDEALLQEPTAPAEAGASTRTVHDAPKPVPVRIDRGIFRAYDIRGVVGQTLDIGVAELIGQAVGTLMYEKEQTDIVVGRDGRLSGPDLVAGLVEGLRRAGRNVIDIGVAPTPLVYFGGFHLRTGSGIAVTGSHNPPDYNGFKIVVGGHTLSGKEITDLHTRIAEDRLHTATTPGSVVQRDISDDYVARIASDVQIDRRLKVVVDAGNGAAGELGPRVLEAIGAEVTPLFCDIDGTFPNHHPDPSDPQNLQDLIQMVQRLDADLGIAFDGDGDRLGVVTRDGENIYADRLLMLFASDVLERNPGAVIVFDVKCTGRLPGHILRHGGSPLMWKTGHSLIKAKMRETEAELAGEMSGHFFFGERWYGFDDAIYAAARLLEILAATDISPTDHLNALPNGTSTPEIKVEAPDANPHAFVERFQETARFEGGRVSTIDGVRIDWPDGWGLVRASNTTPVLVLRFDADSPEALHRIQAAFREQLLAVRPDLALPF